MKTSVVTLFVLVVCVGGTYCVLVVAWRGGFFSGNPPNSRSHSYDDLARGPTHRPPVKIKPGSHAGLVARLLHTKHLTPSDRDTFNACQEKHRNSSDEWKLGDCVFINPINRSAVALVSLPGSGNTWLRGLLERATGVCTGAIYCDVSLREQGFNGEGIKSGAVLVVKTHVWWSGWNDATMKALVSLRGYPPDYGSAILLIRNPSDAMVAEWNRRKTPLNASTFLSHTHSVGPEFFGTNVEWNAFVKKQIGKWVMYFDEWLVKRGSHPVMVVRYEDILSSPAHTVGAILDFLQYPYSHEDIRWQLSRDFTMFQRQHPAHPIEHFTVEQKALIRNTVRNVVEYLNRSLGGSFGVEKYLNTSP